MRFANRYAMQTSFIMPAQNVTVEARYRDDWYDALGVGGGCATGVGGIALLVVAYLLTRQK